MKALLQQILASQTSQASDVKAARADFEITKKAIKDIDKSTMLA